MYLLLTLDLGVMVSLAWNPIGPASNLCLKSAGATEVNQHVPLLFVIYLSNAQMQNIKFEKNYKLSFYSYSFYIPNLPGESSTKLRIWYAG